LASDAFAQYSLRSTFFLRSLRGIDLWKRINDVRRLERVAGSFDWSNRGELGIEADAWEKLIANEIAPPSYFCHPRVLSEQPQLLLYYRTLALLSQKGLRNLVTCDVAKIERGGVEQLDGELTLRIAVAINSILSAVITVAAELKREHLPGLQFAGLGPTVQGSWNNAIGTEGECAIKTILVTQLQGEILQVVWRSGESVDYRPALHTELVDRIGDVRIVRMRDGFHLFFSSEPDISLRDARDKPLLAIEVKAGHDAPAVLERLGAAMKSFDRDRALNPHVKTVYVVRCLTPELERRISQGSPFDFHFSLAEILADRETQQVFANLVLRTMLRR
jgi:hypothetical protein